MTWTCRRHAGRRVGRLRAARDPVPAPSEAALARPPAGCSARPSCALLDRGAAPGGCDRAPSRGLEVPTRQISCPPVGSARRSVSSRWSSSSGSKDPLLASRACCRASSSRNSPPRADAEGRSRSSSRSDRRRRSGWTTGRSRTTTGLDRGPASASPSGPPTATRSPTGSTATRSSRPPRRQRRPAGRRARSIVDLTTREGPGTIAPTVPPAVSRRRQGRVAARDGRRGAIVQSRRAGDRDVCGLDPAAPDRGLRRPVGGGVAPEDPLVAQVVAARDGAIQTGFFGPPRAAARSCSIASPPAETGRRRAGRAVTMLDSILRPRGRCPSSSPRDGRRAVPRGRRAPTRVRRGRQGGERVPRLVGVDVRQRDSQRGLTMPRSRTAGVVRLRRRGRAGSSGPSSSKGGTYQGFLYDRLRAEKGGVPSTGNGRRESYASPPIPRMTNTNILDGGKRRRRSSEGTDRGVFVTSLGGGQVNPASGDFVFGDLRGVPDRRREGLDAGPRRQPDRPLIEVMSSVDAVADDFDTWEGVCGKDGQQAPVGNGSRRRSGSRRSPWAARVPDLDDLCRIAVEAAEDGEALDAYAEESRRTHGERAPRARSRAGVRGIARRRRPGRPRLPARLRVGGRSGRRRGPGPGSPSAGERRARRTGRATSCRIRRRGTDPRAVPRGLGACRPTRKTRLALALEARAISAIRASRRSTRPRSATPCLGCDRLDHRDRRGVPQDRRVVLRGHARGRGRRDPDGVLRTGSGAGSTSWSGRQSPTRPSSAGRGCSERRSRRP